MTATAFDAFVDDAGKLGVRDRASWRAYLSTLKGRDVVVLVKRRAKRQGNKAMRYYRGVVVPDIAAACGYTDPIDFVSVHDALAFMFLRLPDHPEFGTPRRRSTAKDDLTSEEMTDYIQKCIEWAETSVPGCRVRRPDDVDVGTIYAQEFE